MHAAQEKISLKNTHSQVAAWTRKAWCSQGWMWVDLCRSCHLGPMLTLYFPWMGASLTLLCAESKRSALHYERTSRPMDGILQCGARYGYWHKPAHTGHHFKTIDHWLKHSREEGALQLWPESAKGYHVGCKSQWWITWIWYRSPHRKQQETDELLYHNWCFF